ncbi:hypothetical protein P7C73_g5515, partial [Tremellales sp. Uapishka_1]
MATCFADLGSPLDEYLKDEEESNGGLSDARMTQQIPASTSPPISPIPISPISLSPSAFAEQFKYLICSSGLLEKDYVPGLSSGPDLAEAVGSEPSGIEAEESVDPLRWIALEMWARERWDLVGAGVVLVIALGWVVGFRKILGFGMLGLAGMMFWRTRSGQSITSSTPITPISHPTTPAAADQKASILDSLSNLLLSSQQLDAVLDASLLLLQPHTNSLTIHQPLRTRVNRLTDSMTDHLATATSRLLSFVDKRELGVLGEMYDIPVTGSFFYSRKQGGWESDEEEEALPEKPTDSIPSPKRIRSKPIPFLQSRPMDSSQSFPGRIRPHSHHLSLIPHEDLDKFTSLPPRTPRLSKRSSMTDLWTHGHTLDAPISRVADSRRPKHERRITEVDENEGDRSGSSEEGKEASSQWGLSIPPGFSTPRRKSPLSRPSMKFDQDRLLSETIMETIGNQVQSAPLHQPFLSTSSSSSENHFPYHDTSSPTPPGILSAAMENLLPSPRISALPNPKRRSLQSMPYYHSSDDDTGSPRRSLESSASMDGDSSALSRTRSLPYSPIQSLRANVATGSGNRRKREAEAALADSYSKHEFLSASSRSPSQIRSPGPSLSLHSPDLHSSFPRYPSSLPSYPQNRLSRIPSVSPLTLPALKASCLGIHLKRRRMVCCLLGLYFRPQDYTGRFDKYWEEVGDILDDLRGKMREEKEDLEKVVKTVEGSDSRVHSIARTTAETGEKKWLEMGVLDMKDFAPKTSDEALLLEQVENLKQGLQKTLMELCGLDLNERGEVEAGWKGVRENLGGLIRDWERGKDVVHRIGATDREEEGQAQEETKDEEEDKTDPNAEELPEFLQAWREEPIFAVEDQMEDKRETEEEQLPPPGIDQVFEATSLPPPRKSALSGLSREERIRLTKEAREKGVPLGEIMGTNGVKDLEQRSRMAGGEVVDELKGVIGLIRVKKGRPESEEPEAPKSPQARDFVLSPAIRR